MEDGIKNGELIQAKDLLELTFYIWGMISGVIMCFVNNEEYLTKECGYTKEIFLKNGFERIYQTIRKGEK